jgi:hypothetical protein
MSNLGRKLRRWTYSEITRLHTLYESGKSRAEIAADLEMEEERVRQRLQWEASSSTLGIARKRRRRAQREATKNEQRSPRQFFEMVTSGPTPTDKALEERKARLAAMPRDLAGAFFGDPPVGFSALEQRA